MRSAILLAALLLAGCASPPETRVTAETPTPTSTTVQATPGATAPPSSAAPGSTAGATSPSSASPTPPPTSVPPSSPPEGACAPQAAPFPADFTDRSALSHVTQIGLLNAGSASRSYVHIAREPGQPTPYVPLYAPTNATLISITYALKMYSPEVSRGEYRLEFRASCEVTFFFDHIARVEPWIAAAGPSEPARDSRTGPSVSIPVTAGQRLGETNGTLLAGSFDFALFDTRAAPTFANPARWASEHHTRAVCPYDRFDAPLREAYGLLLSSPSGARVAGCGSAVHDAPGTLAGGWFQGASSDMRPPMLVVGALLDGTVQARLIGADGSLFDVWDTAPDALPAAVGVGQGVCYQSQDRRIWLSLVDATHALVDAGPLPCPTTQPGAAATWER